ncbi:DUF1120 domain-containing protein [Serratia marcescens]|jgi:type 1 fimbria pilin|uniref:DUF1120 domain-containing protein n=1 Tax=Serratia surfactantfaciens TaxID=2741499 RepID=A0ABS0M4U0_9GAMM|nr:DUF1120 domain-containing protein [Serratia surfactantfaciens]MBH1922351.1 DUF1120 domain-containing protein [Serratia surfactantfaciens]WMW60526.1 DUF1120 domain-containing protein [Serratia marcescens]
MMKKTVISASIIAVMMMANQVSAASMSPELKVKGQMAVPSCEVVIANDGVFDLGKLSNTLINSTASTALAKSQKQLAVNCEAETFLNFTVVDNREGTASVTGGTHFGLGGVNGAGKLGYYKVSVLNATVNALSSSLYSVKKGTTTFSAASSVYIDKNNVIGWAKSGNVQNSGKIFSAVLEVEPYLASTKDMNGPITDNVKLDGSSTLSFAYGI